MRLPVRLRSWLRWRLRRARLDREMREEMRFHLEAYADDLVRSGVPEAEARRRARVEFGSPLAREDECRDALGLRLMDELQRDLHFAVRRLRRSPGFATVAILSLALGIGANTAIFSMIEAALWRPLQVPEPERLRLLSWTSGPNRVMGRVDGISTAAPGGVYAFSYPAFLELQRHDEVLDALFAFKPVARLTAIVTGQAESLTGELVTGGYFAGLGVRPALGRILSAIDDQPRSAVAAVISDAFWTRQFGRAASAVGTVISIHGTPVTIVGVAPAGFASARIDTRPDIFLPLRMQPIVRPERRNNETALNDPNRWWLPVMGRLRQGVTDEAAQPVLDAVLQRVVRSTLPDRVDRDRPRLRIEPGGRGLDLLTRQYETPLLVLISLTVTLLVIACANVAGVLLARTAARDREVTLRLALGAGRWRLARQLLTEGLVLSVLAGATGLVLAYWLGDGPPRLLATAWQPDSLDGMFTARVVGVSMLVALSGGVLCSVASVWWVWRRHATLTGAIARVGGSRPRGRVLVAAQVALSIVLLLGAGLFARTLWNLSTVPLGFDPEGLTLFAIDLPSGEYGSERRRIVVREIEERIAAVPGVERVTVSTRALLAFSRSITSVSFDLNGSSEQIHSAWALGVGDGYFETMRIPLVTGRPFTPADERRARPAAVVNQELVRRYLPDRQPLGRLFRSGDEVLEIVGVVGDARYDQLTTEMPPTFYTYLHRAANAGPSVTVTVRTGAEHENMLPAIREAVRSIDSRLPLIDVRSQTDQIAATIARQRLLAAVSLTLGGLAAVLAGLGIYGIVANGVARRTSEIGLRIALGAGAWRVLGGVLSDAALVAGVGAAIGTGVGLWLVQYVRTLLFGVNPIDPPTVLAAVLLMLALAVAAGGLPAWRASRLDPVAALRRE
jgi:predicted permease